MRVTSSIKLLALASALVLAQNETTGCQKFGLAILNDSFNASGSVTIHGFLPGDQAPDSTWTYSRFVNFERNGDGEKANVSQAITLKTSKNLDLFDKSYGGCFIAFQGVKTTAALPIQGDNEHKCIDVLGDACQAGIVERLTPGPSTCQDIVDAIGVSSDLKNSNCTETTWTGVITADPIFQSSCKVPGAEDAGNVIMSYEDVDLQSKADDFSLYDKTVGIPGPFVSVIWKTTGPGARVFAPRFMCIPVDRAVAGSRPLPQAPSNVISGPKPTESAAAGRPKGVGVFVLIGLVVLLATGI